MARITLRPPDQPPTATRQQLCELIGRRRLEIAAAWEAAVARVEGGERPALRGRILEILDRVSGVATALVAGGDVEVPQDGPDGDLAWRADPGQVVVELGVLRDCIAAVCDPNPSDAVRELRVLERAMDVVTASAVEHHARELERAKPALEQLAAANAELAEHVSERKFLDDVTTVLSSSLNYYDTLEKIAKLAVPAFADWCVVDLVEDGDTIRRVAIVHSDPSRTAAAHEWVRKNPVNPNTMRGAAQVIRTGETEFAAHVTDEMIAAAAPDAEQARALRELGLRSYVIVPLRARGRVLGAISLVVTESERSYDQSDVELAKELGYRAGMAVDNARLYHEAQQAVRMRENTLAIVSHDLRNPLGAIDLSASMLLQGVQDDRSRKHLEIIRRASDRMERLIRDLLDMASIQAGRFAIERKTEDAAALVGDALETSEPLAAEKGVQIRRDLAIDGTLDCDRNRIAQVLGNLLGNAIKFCKAGDAIDVRATSDGDHVQIEIADTGPGISPEELPHIFEPYWSARRHAQKGTGLGLYISKGIVEAHGGRIRVDSALGRGTTFDISIPRAGSGRR